MKEKRIPNYLGGVKATLAYLMIVVFALAVLPPLWAGNIAVAKDAATITSPPLMLALSFYFAGKAILDK